MLNDRSKITQVSYLTQTDPMNSYSQGKRNDTRINAYVALRARKVKRWQSEITYDFTFNHKKDLQDALTLFFWKEEAKNGIIGMWIVNAEKGQIPNQWYLSHFCIL